MSNNISAKGASFEFGGKVRKMIFINRAVVYLQEKHDGFMKAIQKIDDENNEIDYDILSDILYAGFMTNKDPELTVEFIRGTLDDMTLIETREMATTHLVAALTGSYPDSKSRDSGGPQ